VAPLGDQEVNGGIGGLDSINIDIMLPRHSRVIPVLCHANYLTILRIKDACPKIFSVRLSTCTLVYGAWLFWLFCRFLRGLTKRPLLKPTPNS